MTFIWLGIAIGCGAAGSYMLVDAFRSRFYAGLAFAFVEFMLCAFSLYMMFVNLKGM